MPSIRTWTLIAREKHSESLSSILALLRTQGKFDFRAYKRTTLARRTVRRMSLHEIESPDEYLDYLREHPDELNALVHDLLISVTDFFRDPEGWEQLRRQVVVPLLEDRADDETIRVWVPGCATGEEAYSIAMLMLEECQRSQMDRTLAVEHPGIVREELRNAIAGESNWPASGFISVYNVRWGDEEIEDWSRMTSLNCLGSRSRNTRRL